MDLSASTPFVQARRADHLRIVGPNLRATDVRRDVLRDKPCGLYPLFDFGIPVGVGKRGTAGDKAGSGVIAIDA